MVWSLLLTFVMIRPIARPLSWTKLIERLPAPVLWVLSSVVLSTILTLARFDGLESGFYDGWMGGWIPQALQGKPSSEIALIALDDHTAKTLDLALPLTLREHARLMQSLATVYKPRAVAYTLPISSLPSYIEDGEAFVNAAQALESQGRPVILGTRFKNGVEEIPAYPLNQLKTAPGQWDEYTAVTHWSGRPAFLLDLAQRIGWAAPALVPRGAETDPGTDITHFRFRYTRNIELDPQDRDFHPARGPYRIIPFIDVVLGETPVELLQDKVVLIGKINHDDPTDFMATPFQHQVLRTPKLSVEAAILDSIRGNTGIITLPLVPQWIITTLLGALTFALVLDGAPLGGAVLTVAGLFGTFLAAFVLFGVFGIWMRMTEPLLVAAVGYYLGIPYRLLREHRARWELEQQNEMLQKVEDLKDHFLALVTHDLKTPLARIQGLSERVIQSAPGAAVLHLGQQINRAAHDLNSFVSQLLELGKIDSHELRLQIRSRDINRLVEETIQRSQEKASERQMQIQADLEPLFPLALDERLVTQILQNLIDNAVKYGAPGTTVQIRSRENPATQSVEVSVSNFGDAIPQEELQHLFNRFYRSPGNEKKGITGNGLGLYLSRYFARAHGGELSVYSVEGTPTVFTLTLPLQAAPGLLTVQEKEQTQVEDGRL